MTVIEVLCLPNPLLRKKARDVKRIGGEERNILVDMAQTMYLKGGVGLAAVQVGIDKSLVVVDIGDGLMKFINPIIIKKEGSESQEEGCLSVPETCVNVKRAKKIVADYLNEKGEPLRIAAEGLLARVLQHEIDHLMGKLIVDYMSPLKKLCKSLTIRKL
ncbi:MAG: peptide deformylase [Omnitrophica bacterium RIFCSPLOWO2_02_FULL_45_16]|nr:MAG: peptide deformylase [Omnitrophica bacterium RIFCSPLOWO2_01_FULL_45_24]OGW94052.1 MAG: peptide deformylase [Omnitrophica bacterium RIFCSPLOWO2_12_FULL_45_13]OGX00886.1 MAG: peptide deformylase [Omnitrophica bacterium RIFCSPLOWO2_02_FULL_45_16]